MPMTHRQIDVFRALMQAGGVSAAAQALNSSQPTLSRELARMEQQLGYALFERTGGRLRATAAAHSLFEVVQQHYQGLAAVQSRALALAQAEAQPLQVLAQPALAHALVPAVLKRFALEHPEAHVDLTPAEGMSLVEAMAAQRFDVALTEQVQPPPGCESEPLSETAELAVLPAHHPLAQRARLSLTDFGGQPFISLADDDPYRRQIDAAFAAAGVARVLRLQTHSAVAVCALVAAGLGLSIVNPFTARACAGPELVARPLDWTLPFRLTLLRPLQRPRHRLAAPFEAALRATLQEPPQAPRQRRRT
ncbi:LysR family transcriptional regulator [Inhella gelatinilytica]|uniref:LysR family transcriptional regulator n=1 Tax=Inhella gelatinilytica TaxID=2795030 RepID=A0A931ITX8_9BURK|nr:LysR family transcriptional regulator [Inhella gelatinilytica]MBH9552712.1 LysR family transcriptional regulator [Inhella gelatinilytica]